MSIKQHFQTLYKPFAILVGSFSFTLFGANDTPSQTSETANLVGVCLLQEKKDQSEYARHIGYMSSVG